MNQGNNSELLRGGDQDLLAITVDSKYYRGQFDDWVAGGRAEYRERTFYWAARDSQYGYGWEIEPVGEDDWNDISEDEVDRITALIKKCLQEHKSEYVFPVVR